MANAPEIIYRSSRLVGLELELDAAGTAFRRPRPMAGWQGIPDGSLNNGMEYVLEPARPFNDVAPFVHTFSDAVSEARTNIGKKGGYHVHVQAHDVTHPMAANVVNLYSHFQSIINKLLAPSRSNNRYCRVYRDTVTGGELASWNNLNSLADTRTNCKWGTTRPGGDKSERYRTVNLSLLRCRTPAHRSIEFRQGSPSRKFENIYGWCALMVAFVDLGVAGVTPRGFEPSLAGMMRFFATHTPDSNLDKWIEWRHEYMNQEITTALIKKAAVHLQGAHGAFHVSRALNVPVNVAQRILTEGAAQGLITRAGTNSAGAPLYRAGFEVQAPEDLLDLATALAAGASLPALNRYNVEPPVAVGPVTQGEDTEAPEEAPIEIPLAPRIEIPATTEMPRTRRLAAAREREFATVVQIDDRVRLRDGAVSYVRMLTSEPPAVVLTNGRLAAPQSVEAVTRGNAVVWAINPAARRTADAELQQPAPPAQSVIPITEAEEAYAPESEEDYRPEPFAGCLRQ